MDSPKAPLVLKPSALAKSIGRNVVLLFGLLGFMWLVEAVDLLTPLRLDYFGIRPRTLGGLLGIPLAPFLHYGFGHLLANSVPFVVLGGLVLLGGRRLFWNVSIFCVLVGGLFVWLVGARHSIHLGASGLIFGYLGFLLARGVYERSWRWIVISLVVLVLYGSIITGVLPTRAGISWESHLFGLVAGVGAARILYGPNPVRR